MKELNYSLNIKKERQTYTPTAELITPIINSNNRIFEISCKSGSGKTFLLNLIAYALEANKLGDEYILPSLKDSVSRYNNEEFYSLAYKIKLKLPDGRNLILEKDAQENDKLIHYENQPPINYHSLHQRVTVLYDVPSNPSERLDGVIKDLGIWNENILSEIKGRTEYLNELKRSINNERDDEKIAKYKREFKSLEQKLHSESKLLKDKKASLENLEVIQKLGDLQIILKKRTILSENIDKTSKELKELKRPSRSTTKDLKILKGLEEDFIKASKIYHSRILELAKIISSKEELSTYINQTSALNTTYRFIKEADNLENVFTSDNIPEIIAKIKRNLTYFKDSIINFLAQESNSNKYKLNESLLGFIEVVKKFKEADSITVLENITNVEENKLKSEIQKAISENVIVNYEEINNFLKSSFNDIKDFLDIAFKKHKEILKENNKRDIGSSEKRYNKLKARLKSDEEEQELLMIKKENLKSSCFNVMGINDITRLEESSFLNESIFNYKHKTSANDLEDINSSIDTYLKEIENIQVDIKRYQVQKDHFELRYNEEKNKISGEYSEVEKENIDKFIRHLQMAIRNLTVFSEIIKDINNGDLNEYKHREDKTFMEVAGRIIAYSMDNKLLWSNGEYIGLNSYDLLEKSFNCDDNIIIHRDDLSTGLSSANYLKQRIDNVKGDYVIILLDEIGNMSSDILNEVLASIKKIEEEDRLVLALLTHPNTYDIKIIPH